MPGMPAAPLPLPAAHVAVLAADIDSAAALIALLAESIEDMALAEQVHEFVGRLRNRQVLGRKPD